MALSEAAADILAMPSWAHRRAALAKIGGRRDDILREVVLAMEAERAQLTSAPGEAGAVVLDRDGVKVGRWVALVDGRIVGTWSDDWRAECEARAVCKMRSKSERRRYVAAVGDRRGRDEMIRLSNLVHDVWAAEFVNAG